MRWRTFRSALISDEARQRDGPATSGPLGRSDEVVAVDVPDLLDHGDCAPKEVDMGTAERNELARPQARVGREVHERAVPSVDGRSKRCNLFMGQEPHGFGFDPGWFDAPQRVPADQLVVDSLGQHPIEGAVRLERAVGIDPLGL